MSRREKIIISIMAVTVLVGGYLYFGPRTIGSRDGVEKGSEGAALDFAQKAIQRLKTDNSLTKELFTIRSAERTWKKDPFLPSDGLLSDTQPRMASDEAAVAPGIQSTMVYTGYLEVGAQRLAIINGLEYAPGEALDDRGYYVRRILPQQVEIGKRNEPGVTILKLMEYTATTSQ